MFRTEPPIRRVGPGLFELTEPLIWSTRDDRKDEIVVPAGERTDLASIPRFLRDRKAFDQLGDSFRPGILHDYLYRTGKYGKAFADELFYLALRSEGVSTCIAWMYYKAVDWFGHGPYNEHARRRALAEKIVK